MTNVCFRQAKEETRRSREERHHGGCASSGLKTAALQRNDARVRRRASLRRTPRTRHLRRPRRLIRPMLTKPADHLVVFFGRKCLATANAGKKTTICSAVPSNSRLTEIFRRAKGVGQAQQMICKLRFHAAVIVGCFPLCNRKHPIRIRRGKFPIIAA